VIASRIDGITEVVTNNINALLFNPGDEDELTEAIQRLICDRNFADKLGANARMHVLNNFSIEKSVQKTIELYFDLSCEE
jgi:glycosyltransferase involved in cell wall biosynthesis